jgi:hypothetical protein
MVAAMPLQNDARPSEKTVTLRDIRRVAFGLTAAIMIVMIAGAINDDSGSATTLEEKSEARFAIGITTVAGDNVVTNSEASAGFTVSGTTDQLNTLVTCSYGGVSATDTSDASTGAFSCAYDDSGSNGFTDMSAVNDGTITVTATVGAVSSTVFVTQDTLLPTLTIDMASDGASVGGTNYATIGETITLTITVSESVTGLSCTILSEAATMGGSGQSWTAALEISGNEAEGAATFSCGSHEDSNGNSGATDTTANTGGVEVDYSVSAPAETTAVTTPDNDASPDVVVTASEDGTFTMGGSCGTSTSTSLTENAATTLTLTQTDDTTDLAAGTYSDCTLTFTDNAGNTASALALTTFTIDLTAPTLSSVTMTSNNGNDNSLSIDGDVITLSFTASETLDADPTCVMLFNGVSATNAEAIDNTNAPIYTCTVTTDDNDADGDVTFTLDFTDAAGNAGTQVTTLSSGATSGVEHDDTAPTLSITVASSNSDTAQAKSGDTIILTITASEAVTDLTCTVGGDAATMGGSGTSWTAEHILDGTENPGDLEGNAGFSCDNAADAAGNTMAAADTTADTGSVNLDFTAPTLTTLAITSDNSDNTEATTGDTITLDIVSSEEISSLACTIAGQSATVASDDLDGTDSDWSATYTILGTETEGDTAISCTAGADAAGNVMDEETTATAGAVNIDYTAPTLTTLTIVSDNSDDTGYATTDDDITIDVVASESISNLVCTIAGETIDNFADEGAGTDWGGTYTVDGAETEGTAAISCTAGEDAAGNVMAEDTTTSDGNDVIIDYANPTLDDIVISSSNDDSTEATTGDTITLTITASEAITGLVCTIDGEATTMGGSGTSWTSSLTVSGDETQGDTSFSCTAGTDVAGNTMAEDTDADSGAVNIDYTAPTIGISSTGGDGYVNAAESTAVVVTGTTTGVADGTSVTVTYGGSGNSETGTVNSDEWSVTITNPTGVSDGLVAVTANVADAAGNDATQASVNALQDTVAPTVTVSMGSYADDTGSSGSDFITTDIDGAALTATLSTALAAGETLQLSIDGGSTYNDISSNDITNDVDVSTSVTLNGDGSEGTDTLIFRVVDTAGNAGTTESQDYTVDLSDPTFGVSGDTTISSSNSNTALSIDGDTVTVTVVASETIDTPTCAISVDGNPATNDESIQNTAGNTWTCSVVLDDADSDGSITFSITPTDTAGNAGDADTTVDDASSVTHDDTSPTLTPVSIVTDNTDTTGGMNGDTITLSFTASETISPPTCTFSDAGSNALAGSVAIDGGNDAWTCEVDIADGNADGLVTFSIAFSDEAGNAGTAVTTVTDGSSVTIDNTHPSISSVSTSWGTYLNAAEDDADGTVTVTTSGAEDGQTVTTTINGVLDTCTLNTNTCAVTVAAADLAALTDGTSYTISVDVSDAIGNAADQDTSESFEYDVSVSAATETTAVSTPGNDGSPDVTINVAEAGTIAMSGSCGTSSSTTVSSGDNTITLTDVDDTSDLGEATYSDCTVTFTDDAGNDAAALPLTDFVIDSSAPTLTPVSIVTDNTDTTGGMNGDTITLSFTASETISTPTCTFSDADSNALAGSVTVIDGGNDAWTCEVDIADDNAEGVVTFSIAFSDEAGNAGTAVTTVTDGSSVTIDNIHPTVTITAAEVSDGDTSNDGTLALTFTTSEATSDFAEGDISVSGGTLSDFASTSSTVYTATFTPSADGDTTVNIAANGFTDTIGNTNTVADEFNWEYDATGPTVTIDASEVDDGDSSNDATIAVTITTSESTTDFVEGDVTVSGGTISDFTGSGTSYTFTFTPGGDGDTTINVAAGALADASGNVNSAADEFNWEYDGTAPSITGVSADWGAYLNAAEDDSEGTVTVTTSGAEDGQTVTVTINSVTDTCTLISNTCDVTVAAADLSALTDGTTYTIAVDVDDAVGNSATQDTGDTFVYDATVPTITITAAEVSDGDTSNDGTLALTFTTSEATSDFVSGGISVSGGTLSDFASTSSTVYTATFTPSAEGATTIDVAANGFTDAAGNGNDAATQFNWVYDTTSPTMTITSDDVTSGDTSNDASITLTFTANSATSDFAAEDITVSGGTISDFASTSDTVYTATFTPSADGDTTVDVAAGGFTDSGGNNNAATSQFTWTYDGTGPTVVITTSESDPATESTFDVTITFGEATTTFASGDITVGGGSVSAFSATSSTVYVATITPSADGTVTVDVAAGIATDTYGNDNSAATQFSIESDQADAPSITSTEVTAGTEDSVYSYSVVATDADDGTPNSNTMTLDCTTCPSWLSLTDNGDGTGTLSGTPGDDDLGANSVVLTVEDGDSLSSTQSFTVTVDNVNDVGTISLSGTPTEDQDLTATVGDDDGLSGVTVTYEWQRSSDASTWTTISGATSSTYTLTQDDVDNYIRVIAVWTDAQGGSESHSAMISTVVSNTNDDNTGTPTISGDTTEDELLTADATPLTDNDEDGMSTSTYTYQWQTCTTTATSSCTDISSASSSTYTLGDNDAGNYVRVGVSYTDDYSTIETVYSAITIEISNVNDDPTGTVSIAGTATEDQVLTASNDLADADGLGTITYTWSNGDTGATTTLGQSDVGNAITVTATYTDAQGTTESVTSTATSTVTNVNDAGSGLSITSDGDAADPDQGDTLTVTGTLVDEDGVTTASPTYLWSNGGTASSVTLTQSDVGTTLSVTITYTDDLTESNTITLTAESDVDNVNDDPTGTVSIAGTATEDQVLTASNDLADADGLGTITYTWSNGDTGATTTLGQSDVGNAITVTATYTDGFGATESVTSTATTEVANLNDDPTGTVSIAGTATEDQELTASNDLADEDVLGTITYTWSNGETGATITLGQSDVGNTITVTASYEDGEGTTESVTSTATAEVTNVNDDPTGTVSIAGTAAEDQELTASNDLADEDGLGTITYTWSNGETGETITLDQSDVGSIITVTATYEDLLGASESVTSTATAAVENVDDVTQGVVTVTGDTYDDEVLTAVTSALTDEDGIGTFTYQWANQDGDITGATSSTYTIGSCCTVLGDTYTVTVVHTDGFNTIQTMTASTATAAVTLNPDGDLDGDTIINSVDTDDDGDGYIDTSDAFPTDSTEWADTDTDGIGNNADTDDDGDGVSDANDDFPLDSSEQYDADGDGFGHNADNDDDGDGIQDADDSDRDGDGEADATDAFPDNYNEWADTDSDGIGNNEDTDDDADGVLDAADAFPLDSTETVDTDGDGTGNNADTDDDGDGYSDADETTNCGEGNDPLDATSTPTDTDGDLSCNALDADDDGDGVDDTSDAFPLDASETSDYDGDLIGDNADTDDDNDGYADDVDAFDNDVDAWTDTDGDGLADDFPNLSQTTTYSITVTDTWNDGYHTVVVTSSGGTELCNMYLDSGDTSETCTFALSAGTATVNLDTDSWYGEANVAITTPSGVTTNYGASSSSAADIATLTELSVTTSPATSPAGTTLDNDDDGDTVSDADEIAAGTDPLVTDTDGDGDDDANDQFPLDATEWDDSDSDGMGDNSDAFPTDACATVDTDGDGQPDTVVAGCTTTLVTDVDDDNDGVSDAFDAFPLDATETTDTDNDGTGNNADTDDDNDGYADADDWAPLDSAEWWDTDGDTIGNNADADDDNDGTPDGTDTYPMDNDNDGWDDVYEDACGTDKTDITEYPSDNDADTVKLAHTGVQTTAVNLCDAIDPDDDNDGHLDGVSTTIGGQYVSFTSLESSITLPAGETLDVVMNTYSYGSEAILTMVMPDGTSVDMGSFSSFTTSTWSYTDAGTYSFTLGDSWGDGGQMLTTSWSDDMFPLDVEAWDDTDGDGLTDYIDPNSTAYSYTTVQLCSGYGQTNPGTPWYTMSSYPSPAVGDYIAVDSGSEPYGDDVSGVDDSVSCTFDLPAGETLTVTLQTASYGDEAVVTVAEPSGTSTTYNGFSTGSSNTVGTYTTAGTYTVTYGDSYGDGCNPSTYWGACFVQASYTYISGTVAPTVTTFGTSLDYDDDNDGYSDLDETTNCDDGGAYASSSLPLDATSTPADMDADLTCDALDSDRDGDTYANDVDVFPDDVNDWADNDGDGTGDNADTDDDNDLTPDVSDAFPMDECADTDTDDDGSPDTIVTGCTTSLTEDANDDNDQDDDVDDPFPLDDTEWDDTDSDGIGNNADTDDDGDGTLDVNDVWPIDLCAANDFDSDGLPDTIVAGCTTTLTEDLDDDNDGVDDLTDDCPYDANEQVDTDGDGFCDNQDTDDDNDGTYDLNDEYPLDATEQTDNDGDGIGDNADTDDDNDGVDDALDAFPNDPSETSDFDGDGLGDNADLDDDGDNVLDDVDPFPLDGTAWVDTDGDGIPDYTGPPPFSGDFEGGAVAGIWQTSSLATYPMTADSGSPISGAYSAMSTNQGVSNSASGTTISLTNMVNDTDTDGDGIADAASYSFAYSVSSESGWDFLVFCIDNDANCQRTSGYEMRWAGVLNGVYSGTVDAGAHTFTWNYWKDSSASSNADTAWIDDVTMSVPQGITNADLDDDNDGVNDDMDLDPVDPCVGLDTDGDGMADNLGASMLNGSACDASMYTVDDDDDNDGWSDSDEATCGSDSLDVNDMPADYDMDMVCDVTDLDDDNDGFNDDVDAFPMNSSEAIDTDGDGIGNNADSDDDDDTVTDGLDAFPLDSSESNDNDGDGTGDNADTDDDNDGCLDADDAFPLNAAECIDTDGDMLGDNVDPDDDGDGVADVSDPFPLDASESSDNDGDGIGDNTDTDDDGDGVDDVDDMFPLDPLESEDLDMDGQGDNSDADDDGDGVNDGIDAFPTDASEWVDTDGDGQGDNSDTDDDGDGVDDVDDAFPLNPSESNDLDGDGLGDNADSDDDGDGDADDTDQFPTDASEWDDTDGDGIGNNEDTDDDGDDVSDDVEDSCGSDSMDSSSIPSDFDGDGICDVLDLDDNDGPLANDDGGDEPGFGKSLPGFPALFAAIALIGAALIGRRRDD